jgi:SAM-dependent methyltransferase
MIADNSYDELAWFYNRYWGIRYHNLVFPVICRLLLPGLRPCSSILDLCCGTGHLSEKLATRGYGITGIDLSEKMLDFARERLPDGNFFPADARDLKIQGKFDAAVSTFESINHMLTIDEVLKVFRSVSSSLKEGGLFLFDFITEEAYTSEWSKSSALVESDNACIIRGGFDELTRIARTDITMFRLEERWKRTDVTVRQRCYETEEIVSALSTSGFRRIEIHNARTDCGMNEELGVGRFFVLAKDRRTGPELMNMAYSS